MRYLAFSFILLIAIFSFAEQSNAQSFEVYGASSLPQGDFSDDSIDDPDAFLAKKGFGGGVEYSLPIYARELSWVISGAFLFNSVDKRCDDIIGCNIDANSWLNIPVMGGVRYHTEISPAMKLYVQSQFGVNFVKAPTIEISFSEFDIGEYKYSNVKMELTHDLTTSFGFGLGVGVIFNDKWNIGFRYFSLGEPEIKRESEISPQDLEDLIVGLGGLDSEFKSITVLLITIGFTSLLSHLSQGVSL